MTSAATRALPYPTPNVSPTDRLGLTVFFALIAHAIVILGVGFEPDDTPRINRNTMEIILVPSRSENAPEEADYLAQASQEGGGESELKERPVTPLAAPFVSKQAAVPAIASPTEPTPPRAAETPPRKELLTTRVEKNKPRPEPAKRQEPKNTTRPKQERTPQPQATDTVTAAALISRSLEIASLNAEINRKLKAYAERPRHKFINARTREYKYAAYMEAWRAKVERVGNLNYPDEARRKRLSGGLLLDVSLRPDGSVKEIVLRRSSGHKVLDDAAVRIVKLAAPYEPFPKAIREETDILHLERTWQFLSSHELLAR